MIEQYLSNTNESTTIPILQKILELNKALMLHVCATRFDVTGNLKKFLVFGVKREKKT